MPKGPYTQATALPRSALTQADILRAAKRVYEQDETVTEVARDLGVSGGYLGRLLKEARAKGLVHVWVDAEVNDDLAAALRERYPKLVHVEVVKSRGTQEDTIREVATAMRAWFEDLIERDVARPTPAIHQVAIGGAVTHRLMVELMERRQTEISVAPTALTPAHLSTVRHTAPMVASRLADRLGVFGAPGRVAQGDPTRGPFLHAPSCFDAVPDEPKEARAFFARLHRDPRYREMERIWSASDVVFLSAVGAEHVYPDVERRLAALGVTSTDLVTAGAVALTANQFVTREGKRVPLADGVPAYEVAMPADAIRDVPPHYEETDGQAGFVVLDLWGEKAVSVIPVLESGLVNVLFADELVAEAATEARPHQTQRSGE